MTFFFDWLGETKGVKRIIKVSHASLRPLHCRDRKLEGCLQVIVDDLQSPSHSDEAIEKSLKPFVGYPPPAKYEHIIRAQLTMSRRTWRYLTGEDQT